MKRASTAIFLLIGALCTPTIAWSQSVDPKPEQPPKGAQDATKSAKKRTFPQDPQARLKRAQQAYQNAEYNLLRPLLLPTLSPNILLTTLQARLEARTLLGVGAFFEAQAAKDTKTRDQLTALARDQFLLLLKEKPTHTLDSLVYPISIIDLFESVRKDNKAELDSIIAKKNDTTPNPSDVQTIYIERSVSEQYYALNFLPFGVGQFQNDHNIKGTIFAVTQGAALVLNVVSYFAIRSLRQPDTGFFDTGDGDANNSDFAQALTWRQVQYGSLGVFTGLYAWSVIDGIYYHEDVRFRYLRTLDKPPNELRPPTAPGATLSIRWRWHF